MDDLSRMQIAFTGMVDDRESTDVPVWLRAFRHRVFVTQADGSGLHYVSQDDDYQAMLPQWDEDGQTLTYADDYSRASNSWRVRVDGPAAPPVADETAEAYLSKKYSYNQVSRSPDGRLFAVTSLTSEGLHGFWLVTADGQRVASCAQTSTYVGAPTWSPDGRWIAFTAIPQANAADEYARSSLFVFEEETRKVTYVCDAIDADSYLFAWAPDSRRLAVVRDSVLYLVARDGSGLHRTLDLNVGDVDGVMRPTMPAWSPDGR